ncbi:retrotransposon protein, putative, ty1-copia subclass [Tanacetum coccineum]
MRDFHSCKQEEGQSVSSYILKIKSHIDNPERLGYPVTTGLGVSLILISLRKEFDGFVQNYNMHSMRKTINELHAMLKLHKQTLPKNSAVAPALHVIRAGKVQKGNNKHKKPQSQLVARGQNQRKGKNKLAYAPKPKIPPPPKREDPTKDSVCHQCGDTGHWKRNCSQNLAKLLKNKKLSQGTSSLGTLNLYMGNGQHAAVEAIGTYHLSLPSGLVIVLNNCHLAPSITRGIISVSCLYDDGYVNRFMDNSIQVSRNNMVYFSAVPRDGILEINLSDSYTNVSSIYALSNKRFKSNLDSALLWHCRLGHISKKHIEKLQHDGLLNSTDLKAFEKCVPCMSGKMARKPYTHQVERAKDLLGLIHIDVCPFKIMSRQGASYFVTFINDFSRYGYVYLLKHKHEVFETFKVFQKEVENQLGKTIKSLRSDRGERMCLYIDAEEHELGDIGEPANYKAAFLDPESDKWLNAMNASRQYNKRFDDEIKKFGFTQNCDEPCVYLKASGSNVTFLILYVDDILIMGNYIPMFQDVKSYLGRCFAMKDLGEAAYILGIKIYRDSSRRLIGLCQSAYIKKILKRYHIKNSKRGSIPIQEKLRLSKSQGASTPAELKRMQNVPYVLAEGSIKYAVRCTRPDVAFAQNITSRFQQNPCDLHWTTVKNILKYLRNTKDMFLVYGGDIKRELRVSCYTDAGYLTDADDLNIFATSSAEAEYIAAYDASKEAVWVRKFIYGLGVVPTIEEPINMYCDNTGAITIANESGITKGARHFRAKVHYLREVIEFGDIKLEKVHTDDNLADPFTKALAFPKHSEHTKNIGMLPASSLM